MFAFMVVFASDSGLVSRFMSLPIFAYLAKISYSVYMIHVIFAIGFAMVGTRLFPEQLVIGDNANGLWGDLYNIPYLLCVIACSHLTWKYIEVPGAKYFRGLKLAKSKLKVTA